MSQEKTPQKKSLLSTIGVVIVAVLLLLGQQMGLLPASQEEAPAATEIVQATATVEPQITATAAPQATATATPKVTVTATPKATATATPKATATAIIEPQAIVNYLAAHGGELPDNFLTKKEAEALGWDSSRNYLSDVAPGKSIGGDRFGNYEGLLPKASGRQYHEADCYYTGGKRNAYRLVYSTDGLYFYTEDHYESFEQMYPEE